MSGTGPLRRCSPCNLRRKVKQLLNFGYSSRRNRNSLISLVESLSTRQHLHHFQQSKTMNHSEPSKANSQNSPFPRSNKLANMNPYLATPQSLNYSATNSIQSSLLPPPANPNANSVVCVKQFVECTTCYNSDSFTRSMFK